MLKNSLLALVLALLVFNPVHGQTIGDPIQFGDMIETVVLEGEHAVLAMHGSPNGMPCEWYAYSTTVGLGYCAHPGIDLYAYYEPLVSATDGVVVFAGSDGYYYPYHVDIRVVGGPFDGELHIYGHMSEIAVVAGQTVSAGDLLGTTGDSGNAPHLHFERRTEPQPNCVAGCAIDPVPVLLPRDTP